LASNDYGLRLDRVQFMLITASDQRFEQLLVADVELPGESTCRQVCS
jgi:hypothetical protein